MTSRAIADHLNALGVLSSTGKEFYPALVFGIIRKQKHFLVSRVIQPELPTDPIEMVEIEAVFSKAVQVMAWRDLQDDGVWRQGWV